MHLISCALGAIQTQRNSLARVLPVLAVFGIRFNYDPHIGIDHAFQRRSTPPHVPVRRSGQSGAVRAASTSAMAPARVADEVEALPTIIRMLSDYAAVRHQARTCF